MFNKHLKDAMKSITEQTIGRAMAFDIDEWQNKEQDFTVAYEAAQISLITLFDVQIGNMLGTFFEDRVY